MRWAVICVLVVVALLYLNGVTSALWLAGGPPTDTPDYFLWLAARRFGYVVAICGAGMLVFQSMRRADDRRSRTASWVAVIAILGGLAVPRLLHFVAVDRCLDSGGRWSEHHDACQRVG